MVIIAIGRCVGHRVLTRRVDVRGNLMRRLFSLNIGVLYVVVSTMIDTSACDLSIASGNGG